MEEIVPSGVTRRKRSVTQALDDLKAGAIGSALKKTIPALDTAE